MKRQKLKYPRNFKARIDRVEYNFKIFRRIEIFEGHFRKHVLNEHERWDQIFDTYNYHELKTLPFDDDTMISIANEYLDLVEYIIKNDEYNPLHAHAINDEKLYFVDRRGILVIATKSGINSFVINTVFRPTPQSSMIQIYTNAMFLNQAIDYVVNEMPDEYHDESNWLNLRFN